MSRTQNIDNYDIETCFAITHVSATMPSFYCTFSTFEVISSAFLCSDPGINGAMLFIAIVLELLVFLLGKYVLCSLSSIINLYRHAQQFSNYFGS